LKLVQCSFSSVFLGCIDILSIIPILGRDVLAVDTDCAGPGSTLATAVREDVVGRSRDATGRTMLWADVRYGE